jgi:uncharacterized damage-inducible protein DinB
MTHTDALIAELEQEADPTRRVLERVPEDELAWRPHPRSMSAGQLALHTAGLPGDFAEILDEGVFEILDAQRPEPDALDEVLSTLEESVELAVGTLVEWGDEELAEELRVTRDGETVLALPRGELLRAGMLNHWYHHRAQLTVYLRLLDVPVPAVYGPTADEDPFV